VEETVNIKGEFTVDLKPLNTYTQGSDGRQLGHFSIEKTFTGGLTALSKGEMLSAASSVKGSAGYVALEEVKGSLDGKEGSFVLQHFGIMDRNKNRLILEVVPDSGSGELTGLKGKMNIQIENGKHSYEFEWEL
jgi:hypothetical protein